MKIFLLIICKLLAKAIDIVNKYISYRSLKYIRELLSIKVSLLGYGNTSKSKTMAKRSKVSYVFRPFEVCDVDYHNSNVSINTADIGKRYPKARSGHRIVCSDASIYCFGGFNPTNSPEQDNYNDQVQELFLFRELWKYNMVQKEWTLLMDANENLPTELASNAMLLYGEAIMIFGGTGFPFGVNCSNKLHLCFPRKKTIDITEVETSGDKPSPLYGQAIVIHDDFLYTMGGTNGFDYTLDIHRLHLPSRTWDVTFKHTPDYTSNLPARYRHELAQDGSKVYLLGGGTSETAFDLHTIPAYNLNTNKWEYIVTKPDPLDDLPGIPLARRCHSCVQIRTDQGVEVIIAGGYNNSAHLQDVWKLNLSTFQWTRMQNSNLPHPLFFHDATITSEGCMHIFGGIEWADDSFVRTNKLYKMWPTIPRLSAIAWEALQHYVPSLPNRTRSELLEAGIPPEFVDRVHD